MQFELFHFRNLRKERLNIVEGQTAEDQIDNKLNQRPSFRREAPDSVLQNVRLNLVHILQLHKWLLILNILDAVPILKGKHVVG